MADAPSGAARTPGPAACVIEPRPKGGSVADQSFEGLIGRSAPMRALFERITRLAPLAHHVSICGETGTGKELVARAVHRRSLRRDGPFIDVNCAAVPATLFEAEFFGHERGAFTGAHQARPGYFERAHGGTLFLDEIGDLPLDCQAKLLRAVEQRSVLRVGARAPTTVDVRIVSATHVDLSEASARGAFREDLYHRLAAAVLSIPPVRERGSDVDLLVNHFLELASRDVGRLDLVLSDEARRALGAREWPGNVREIEHVVRHAAIEARGQLIELADLPPEARSRRSGGRRVGESAVSSADLAPSTTDREPLPAGLARFETERIERALRDAGGHRAHAAALLGITERTLYNKMRQHGIGGRRPA